MTLSLRRRHRQAFIVLGAFVPAVFVVGINVRKPVPVTAGFPVALETSQKIYENLGESRKDLFSKVPLKVQFMRQQKDPGSYAIELTDGNTAGPDVIVYWAAGNPAVDGTLPDNAVLLGALGASILPLPSQTRSSAGALLLYSLADGEIADVSKLFSLPTR